MCKPTPLFAVFFMTLTSFLLCASDATSTKNAYSLVKTFRTEKAEDMLTFVKKISDKYLVAFDRKGRGELFDIQDNYQTVSGCIVDAWSLQQVFAYQDKNKQDLLVACAEKSDKLYVWKIDGNDKNTLTLDDNFSLHQTIDGSLITINHEDKSAMLELVWEKEKPWDKRASFKLSPLGDEELRARDEGSVVCASSFQRQNDLKLQREIFDIASLSEQDRRDLTSCCYKSKNVHLRPIYCYHKDRTDHIVLGHDLGLISIWAPK